MPMSVTTSFVSVPAHPRTPRGLGAVSPGRERLAECGSDGEAGPSVGASAAASASASASAARALGRTHPPQGQAPPRWNDWLVGRSVARARSLARWLVWRTRVRVGTCKVAGGGVV
eukprot:scaffold2752_cov393-Prasinococcus_capsulatus_cf.AAC.14